MRFVLTDLDPRRSLAAAIGLSIAMASLIGAFLTSLWVGSLTRDRIQAETGAVLAHYATQVSDELDINLDARLQWIDVTATLLGRTDPRILDGSPVAAEASRLLETVRERLPEIIWIGLVDPSGRVVVATGRRDAGRDASADAWFEPGLVSPWIGATGSSGPAFLELAAPVRDASGRTVGVVGAQLGADWARTLGTALTESLHAGGSVQALLVDARGRVLMGPPGIADGAAPTGLASGASGHRVTRWPDGREYVAGYAVGDGFGRVPRMGWTVWVREPTERAFAGARQQQRRVFGAVALLGVAIALAGILLSQRLTRALVGIARSADEIRAGRRQALELPPGADEAARIGRSMQALLNELGARSTALERLNAELDARVAARTREVERMAEENRHAAVVRERLRLSRDLHDTLAHTLMALLTEIRLMRRMVDIDTSALRLELAHAESVAHEGLREARAAIGQLRRNAVRDLGLGAALRELSARVAARTGAQVDVDDAGSAAAMADSRAELLYRIAEEALRNIERHAGASRVRVALGDVRADGIAADRSPVMTIEDDGVGFDASRAPPEGHWGLRGMAEQAELVGGRLAVDSRPGGGTRLSVDL